MHLSLAYACVCIANSFVFMLLRLLDIALMLKVTYFKESSFFQWLTMALRLTDLSGFAELKLKICFNI